MSYDESEWLQRYQQNQLAAQQAKIDARRGGPAAVTVNPKLQAMLDYANLQDIQASQQFTDPTIPTNVYGLRGKSTVPTYEETIPPFVSDPFKRDIERQTMGELQREQSVQPRVINQPRIGSPFASGPSGMQSRGRPTPPQNVMAAGKVDEASRLTGATPSKTYGASRGGSGRLTRREQADQTAESAAVTSAAAQQAIADAYAAIDAATAGNTAAAAVQNQRNIGDSGLRAALAQQALIDQVAANQAVVEQDVTGTASVSADDQMRALLATGGDFAMGGPAGVTTTAAPAATIVADDTAGIEAAAQAAATQAVADPAASAVLPPDIALFQELAALDSDDARAQYGFDKGIINADVLGALRAQEAAGQPMNINLGAADVAVDGVSAGQKAIFEWGTDSETGKPVIQMMSEGDEGDEVVTSTGVTGVIEESEEEETILAADDPEINYLNDQTEIITKAYNDRIDAIEAAVEDGRIDINLAQGVFNAAKDKLFDDMAELNKITYDEVNDTFSFNTQQRATDMQSMLDLLATQGVEQNLIQDVIGGDIGMNLAGYAEETDAMRDFSEMLNIIGQQGRGEAGMLGNYMFDSYRQDLETTGRNMELQAAMQQLAEQQAAAEQNLQSSILGPYFGLDPQTMMAGMGAGVDVAGVSENRAMQDQAAEDAMKLLLAQQEFATTEREAGQTFAGGQNYQNNLWDYVTNQTMDPYQSGMLGVAQQGQQVDTISALMDMMAPAQPSAAQIAASNEQAATLATQSALESAMAKIAMGDIPAQEPIFKQGQMMQGMPGYQMNAASFTGEELMALDSVGVDIEDLTVNRSDTVQSLDNMQTFASAINMPLAELMGAQDMGVLGSYFSEIVAAGNDPYVDYMRPSGALENIQLSQAMKLQEYEYPNIGEDTPYQLGWNPDMPGGNVGSLEQGLNISSLIDLNEALVAAGYDEILGDILGLTTP